MKTSNPRATYDSYHASRTYFAESRSLVGGMQLDIMFSPIISILLTIVLLPHFW
jgi:hypothetical protein